MIKGYEFKIGEIAVIDLEKESPLRSANIGDTVSYSRNKDIVSYTLKIVEKSGNMIVAEIIDSDISGGHC